MDDRGSRPIGYGRGSAPDPEPPRGSSWTPFQGTSNAPAFRTGKSYSPDSNPHQMDMDMDDREGYNPSLASKRLTAHVAPVPGRSMSPDTTRIDPRYGGQSVSRRTDDEDFHLYGNSSVKREPAQWGETKFGASSSANYDDYDRDNRRGPMGRPMRPDPYQPPRRPPSPPRRPPSPPNFAYRPIPRFDGSTEFNDIDAGRRAQRAPIHQENKNFSYEEYPVRGMMQRRQEELKPKVAVYEMNKIPKKYREEDQQEESEESKLLKLRSEHAKIELRASQLKQLIDRTFEKENELKRLNKGRALSDNKEFCDNKKLQMDAEKKYRDALKQKQEMEVYLNAILNAQAKKSNETGDNSQDGENSVAPQKQAMMISTDFLDEKREDKEEEVEGLSKIEFFDGGDHWCEPCQDVFHETIKPFLEHLHTDDHFKNIPANKPVPWPITRRTQNFDPDRQMAAFKGAQFMIPCKAYYCAICKVFCGDKEAAEEHLFSTNHNRLHTRFLISKPEYDHIHNKDKASARAKAAASIRAKKREAEEKKRREEEEIRKREEDERRKREREVREKTIEDNKYMKMLKEKQLSKLEGLKGRERSREKSIDKKRKNVSSSSSSSSSSRDSSLEVHEVRPNPMDDPKIKKKCFVAIPKDEFNRAKKVYGKMLLTLPLESASAPEDSSKVEVKDSPSGSVDNSKDAPAALGEKEDSKSYCSTPSTKEDEDVGKKSNVDDDDVHFDDDDESNFNLSSVLPTALEPDDNAVTSPGSATKTDQIVSSSDSKPSSTTQVKKPVANFDAICNALEDDDDDGLDEKNSMAAVSSSPVKTNEQPKMSTHDSITGRDVLLKPIEATGSQGKSSPTKEPTEDYVSNNHSFPQLSLDDLTKSPSYDDV